MWEGLAPECQGKKFCFPQTPWFHLIGSGLRHLHPLPPNLNPGTEVWEWKMLEKVHDALVMGQSSETSSLSMKQNPKQCSGLASWHLDVVAK